jgi:hypothetical protein
MWPLHTSEALAPLLVALAHIQVALAPISIYRICGPFTWPLHLFLLPLHRPLPREMLLFGRLSGISFCNFNKLTNLGTMQW